MEAGGQKEKRKKKTFVCIYLDVDKGKRRKKTQGRAGGRERQRKGHFAGVDQREYCMQGNCSVLLL